MAALTVPRKPKSPALPHETITTIASILPFKDRRALLLSSWWMHNTVAPVLYRSLELCFQPSNWPHVGAHDHMPFAILACLVESSRRAISSGGISSYASCIVTLSFVSHRPGANLRAIPMLAQVLRSATHLRHLRIDVLSDAIPLILDVFGRTNVIQSATPSLVAKYAGTTTDFLPLPALDTIRSSKPALLEALMRFRSVKTAILDSYPDASTFNRLFATFSPLPHHDLTRLSIVLSPNRDHFPYELTAIVHAFPVLEHLSVRCANRVATELLVHVLGMFVDEVHFLPKLRVIGVNHGAHGLFYPNELWDAQEQVHLLGMFRSCLTLVAFGKSTWQRENEHGPWWYERRASLSMWPWLKDRDRGMWHRRYL